MSSVNFSKNAVIAALSKLEKANLIKITISKTNPWTTPRTIEVNFAIIDQYKSSYKQLLDDYRDSENKELSSGGGDFGTVPISDTVPLSDSVSVSGIPDIEPNKEVAFDKNISPPLVPPEDQSAAAGDILQQNSDAAEPIVDLFYEARNQEKPEKSVRRQDLGHILDWIAQGYPVEVIRDEVQAVAKDPATKMLSRARYGLAARYAQWKKRNSEKPREGPGDAIAHEQERALAERAKILAIREKVSEDELRDLTAEAEKAIRDRYPDLEEWILRVPITQEVNRMLLEKFSSTGGAGEGT